MVFGGVLAATAPLAGAISGESNVTQSWTWAANEDSLDTQDLLVENLRLRRQMATSKEKERKTQEENEHLRRQIVLLQQQQQMMVRSHSRFETELEKAGIMLAQEARVEGDEDLRGLKEGEEGFMDAKVAVLSKRLSAVAKRSCWLQVQVEQARDQAADANRRQVDAERIVSELMKENGPGVSIEYLRAIATEPCTSNVHLPVGSDIWKDDKAFAEVFCLAHARSFSVALHTHIHTHMHMQTITFKNFHLTWIYICMTLYEYIYVYRSLLYKCI